MKTVESWVNLDLFDVIPRRLSLVKRHADCLHWEILLGWSHNFFLFNFCRQKYTLHMTVSRASLRESTRNGGEMTDAMKFGMSELELLRWNALKMRRNEDPYFLVRILVSKRNYYLVIVRRGQELQSDNLCCAVAQILAGNAFESQIMHNHISIFMYFLHCEYLDWYRCSHFYILSFVLDLFFRLKLNELLLGKSWCLEHSNFCAKTSQLFARNSRVSVILLSGWCLALLRTIKIN